MTYTKMREKPKKKEKIQNGVKSTIVPNEKLKRKNTKEIKLTRIKKNRNNSERNSTEGKWETVIGKPIKHTCERCIYWQI